MSINTKQLYTLICETLTEIDRYSEEAAQLVIGVIYQESDGGTYLRQISGGPALGIAQCEPATFYDCFNNYLKYRPGLLCTILDAIGSEFQPEANRLEWDLKLSIIMCRVHFLRDPLPLPKAGDIEGMAETWKRHYNTQMGAGTVQEFIDNFPRSILNQ